MPKILLILSLICFAKTVEAQTADQVYDQYVNFNYSRAHDNIPSIIKRGESILPNVDKLPPKTKIVFYNILAKAYEDNQQLDKATPYYEIVAAAVPDFYVVHRALGYIYAAQTNALVTKMKAEKPGSIPRKQLEAEYKKGILRALPQLEKAQACDPSDETMTLIKKLYNNIGDAAGLQSLNTRLTELSKNCIDVLKE